VDNPGLTHTGKKGIRIEKHKTMTKQKEGMRVQSCFCDKHINNMAAVYYVTFRTGYRESLAIN
jgi:hypothetical protein